MLLSRGGGEYICKCGKGVRCMAEDPSFLVLLIARRAYVRRSHAYANAQVKQTVHS